MTGGRPPSLLPPATSAVATPTALPARSASANPAWTARGQRCGPDASAGAQSARTLRQSVRCPVTVCALAMTAAHGGADERQDRPGDGLIRSADREHFGHMTLAPSHQHGRTMRWAPLAEGVVQGFVERRLATIHRGVDAGIELRVGKHDPDVRALELRQRRACQLRGGVNRSAEAAGAAGARHHLVRPSRSARRRTWQSTRRRGHATGLMTAGAGAGEHRAQIHCAKGLNLDGRDVEGAGHEDHATHADAARTVQLGPADVGAERAVTGRMSPDDHAIGIAVIPADVTFQPIDHVCDITRPAVPGGAEVTLHGDDDQAVLSAPAADIVVKSIGGLVLDLDLVAGATGHVDQDRPRALALIGPEDV